MGMNNIGVRSSLAINMFWKVVLPKELVFSRCLIVKEGL
jgi:hypothetical protein